MKRPNLAIALGAFAVMLSAGLAACDGGGTQLDLVIGDSVPLIGGLAIVEPAGGS